MGCSFERSKMYYNYQCFSENLDESNCKPNKIWLDKGSEFYNRSMKPWLEKNRMEMYSIRNEGNLLLLKDSLEP